MVEQLNDYKILKLVKSNRIKPYMMEKCVNNPERGINLRRRVIAEESNLTKTLTKLTYTGFDYSKVLYINNIHNFFFLM